MTQDPARNRFFVLTLLRLGGVALAFLGVAIVAKRLVEPAEIVGGVVLALGILDVMILPRMLARRWRTPPRP